jgi:predicted metal-dependent phosphoesterase TrpH
MRKPNIIMDTHIHSKASDGAWAPSEVVRQARARGPKAIALTDHDTIYGLPEVIEESYSQEAIVILGIEIDAEYESEKGKVKDIELLSLGINDKILEFTRKRADERKRSLEHYIKALNKYFSSPDFEEKNRGSRFPLKMPALLSVEELIDWKNKKDNYNNPEPLLSKIDVVKYIAENFSGDPEGERKSKSVNREFL